jgi:hypothetical protein
MTEDEIMVKFMRDILEKVDKLEREYDLLRKWKTEIEYQKIVEHQRIINEKAEKTKQKTSAQYVSILYSNLFQSSIPQSELTDLSELRTAIGDKQIADNLIINDYTHSSNVQIPTDAQMRADIPKFVEETYIRFFLRKPSPYEARFMKESIESDAGLTPALIYSAFAESNEYKFY